VSQFDEDVDNGMLTEQPGEHVDSRGEPPEADHREDDIEDSIQKEVTELESLEARVIELNLQLQRADELIQLTTDRCRIYRKGLYETLKLLEAAVQNITLMCAPQTDNPLFKGLARP